MSVQATPLAPSSEADVGGVLVGKTPEGFYPTNISVDSVKCKLQQAD